MSDELDFKVILGNEIYLSEEGLTEQTNDQWTKEGNPGHFYHLILLAKDAEGYEQLKRLSSSAWRRAWFRNILRTPTYPSDLYREVQGGHMICSTACLGGYVARTVGHILELDRYDNMSEFDQMFVDTRYNKEYYLDKLNNHLRGMEELFGKGNFFIELQPNDEEYGKEQIAFNKYMIEHYWGQYPFIFTTDSHYLKEDEREIHKAFLNSKSSSDREVDDFYHKAYMMSQEEIRSLMPYVSDEQFNEMVENTRRIKEMCQFYELEQKPKLATVEYEHWNEYEEDLFIFHEVDKETYPNFYDYLHSENKADNYLARLVAHGYVISFIFTM